VVVVPNAHKLTLFELAAAIEALVERARNGTINMEDVEGGTFTVSNLGMCGVDGGFPLPRPPEGAILLVGEARNEDFLRELGVDEFINYQTAQFENVATEVDLVLDSMSGETRERSWQTLKKGGVLVSILGPASAETAAEYGVRTEKVQVRPNQAQLIELAQLDDAGHIKPVIDTVLPLEDAPKAHQRIEQAHTRGKIVLEVAA
jgi:NADPH-dependent curcumin reductase CurA